MPIIAIKVPALGESVTEATIARWAKQVGDWVDRDETLCELESDKASVEVPAEQAGRITEIVAAEGDTLDVGAVLCQIDTDAEAGAATHTAASSESDATPSGDPEPTSEEDTNPASTSGHYAQGHPSPAAAKLMREQSVTPQHVQASGRDGRITKADVQQAANGKSAALAPKASPAAKPTEKTPEAEERGQRHEKMSSLRKTIAKRLVAVKNETAMLTTFNEVDMQAVMQLRAQYKERFKEKHGVNLGFMSFFTAASCMALQDFPAVNAQINGDEILYHDYCDIGVAVSAPKGLVVPVVRNAEQLNFDEIEKEIIRLAARARDGKLSIDEMTGGTFTITNGGIFGSMLSTPILNAPQCAILGMHNIVERPVAIKGEVVIRPIMYLALSYDHRLIDGREAVGFLVRVKELIEDPVRLMLGV
ncbi:MAG: 2-oxoglutarate dehydrogenase complex dihydrolipoyllysine-residue succinyltransferase [Candidatus Sericytochromatia bacterium]